MTTDLFVLDTPLQLLNSIEARHRLSHRPSDLVLLHWPGWSPRAFDTLLKETIWNSVTWVSMDAQRPSHRYRIVGPNLSEQLNEYLWTFRQFRRRNRLDSVLARFEHVERLIVGNLLNGYMRHVATRLSHKELIAVDDGTDTLQAADERLKDARPDTDTETQALNPFKRAKRYIRERWVEWEAEQPRSIGFFTAYDIDLPPNDQLIRNNYRWLRERATGGAVNNTVYFLGQPLIEDGYLTEATYLDYLDRTIRYFGGKPIVYIPHKRESTKTVYGVKHQLGLSVTQFDDPIEVVLALGDSRPEVLASFFCSALENCSILFGNTLKTLAFYLPKEVLLYDDSPSEGIYEYFRRRQTDSFRVVDTY